MIEYIVFDLQYRDHIRFETEEEAREWVASQCLDGLACVSDFILRKCERLTL